jgi:CxxC motif-containing protein (DUF1111 family)
MKKWIYLPLFLAVVGFNISPAMAIKQFNDQFTATYAKDSKNEEFKKLVDEAKCNVCHIKDENKKKRNEYGDAVAEFLRKKDFPADRFKKEPEKCKEEIEAAFKKVEEKKAKDGKTFGEKLKEGLLPGGNVDGK